MPNYWLLPTVTDRNLGTHILLLDYLNFFFPINYFENKIFKDLCVKKKKEFVCERPHVLSVHLYLWMFTCAFMCSCVCSYVYVFICVFNVYVHVYVSDMCMCSCMFYMSLCVCLCVYVHLSVYVCVCMYVCVCSCMYRDQRWASGFLLSCFLPYFLRLGLSPNLELTDSARLAAHKLRWFSPQCWDCSHVPWAPFFMWALGTWSQAFSLQQEHCGLCHLHNLII